MDDNEKQQRAQELARFGKSFFMLHSFCNKMVHDVMALQDQLSMLQVAGSDLFSSISIDDYMQTLRSINISVTDLSITKSSLINICEQLNAEYDSVSPDGRDLIATINDETDKLSVEQILSSIPMFSAMQQENEEKPEKKAAPKKKQKKNTSQEIEAAEDIKKAPLASCIDYTNEVFRQVMEEVDNGEADAEDSSEESSD